MADSGGMVLVTGGTGFLGGWCIASLLERGYDVRTTVRDQARERRCVDAAKAAGADPGNRLTVLAADLTSDAGWADAVAGCRYVLHVASPFPPVQPKNPDELIVPARDGALRVLRAALDAGVERVAMTSSIAAVRSDRDSSEAAPFTEADWTDGDDASRTPYVRSKTLAEQRRVATRAFGRGGGSSRHHQPGRDHRPGAQRRPLLLASGDPATARPACRRHHGSGSRSWTSVTSPTCTSVRSPIPRREASASSPPTGSFGCRRSQRSSASGSATPRERCRRGWRRTS